MVLHVVGDELYRRILCRVDDTLALTEEHCRLQVGGCRRLYIYRLLAVLAVLQSLLEVSYLTVLCFQLRVLAAQLTAKTVHLGVESVYLRLVAQLCNLEVMRSVRVLELVYDTSVELYKRTVDVVFHAIIARTVEPVVDGRLEIELPLLVRTEVEGEVESHLRCEHVSLVG